MFIFYQKIASCFNHDSFNYFLAENILYNKSYVYWISH